MRKHGHTIRNLAFATVAACLVLGVLEIAARLSGAARFETTGSPLPFQAIGLPPAAPGPSPDSLVYMPADTATGSRRTVVSAARKAGYRVLTFGGSATYGWGFNPLVTFSGRLQAALVALRPPVPVEVINMGVCGWNSSQVRTFLEPAIEAADPDLVIIYSGNNEFIDIQALKMAARIYSAETEYMRRRLSRSHLYRLLRRAITPPAPPPPPTAAVPIAEGLDAPVTDEDREVAAWVYRRNLADMVAIARAHRVAILLATVADNQRDFCSHGCEVVNVATRQWLEKLETFAQTGNPAAVLAQVADPPVDTAEEAVQFRLGRVLLMVDRPEAARYHFEEAERLTRSPKRSTTRLREVVRDVARDTGAPVCDTARLLAKQAPFGIPGSELFFDDCHPTSDGHRRLAGLLLSCLVEQALLPDTWPADRYLGDARARLETPPPPGCPLRVDAWDTMAVSAGQLPPAPGSWCTKAVAGHHAFTAGQPERALDHYTSARDDGGPAGPLELDRGLAAQYAGDIVTARAALGAAFDALREDPDVANYRAVLGGSGH